jgi:ribonuclease VapC
MTPVNLWEVLVRAEAAGGAEGRARAERMVDDLQIQVVPADLRLARSAADTFRRFGRRSSANLNLGDCFAYALAAQEGDGLLYKGDDFAKTDVERVT